MTYHVDTVVEPPNYEPLQVACKRAQATCRDRRIRATLTLALDMAYVALTRRETAGHPEKGARFQVRLDGTPDHVRCDVERVDR